MTETVQQDQFLRLFLQHQLQIDAYVRSVVPNRADAEDLQQEVAAVLWRKFDEFQPGTRFDHWACRIAHNQVLYYYRRRRRDVLAFGDCLLASVAEEAVRQNDQWAERRGALATCLQRLPQPDRELIQRRFEAATTSRSVARETGRSESAISRALNRIYVALLDCIRQRLNASTEGTVP